MRIRTKVIVTLGIAGTIATQAGLPTALGTDLTARFARSSSHGWRIGVERRLQLALSSRATLPGRSLFGLELAGELVISKIADAPQLVVRAQYVGSSLAIAGAPSTSEAALAQALATPFFLTYDDEGALTSVRGARATLPMAVNIVRSVASMMRVVEPPDRPSHWQRSEQDASGTYVAQYDREADGRVRKHKLRYAGGETEVIAADATFMLDGSGEPRSVHASELVRSTRASLPTIEVTTTLSLTLVATSERAPRPPAEAAGWVELLDAATMMRASTDRAALGGLNFADVIERLTSYAIAKTAEDPTKAEREQAARAYAALTAAMRLEPGRIAEVRTRIVDGDPLASTLVSALRDAGTPEAQAALRGLLGEQALDRGLRHRVVRGLSLVEEPTAATVATLRTLENDDTFGTQAIYGLGSALSRLRNQDPDLAAELLAHLLGELASAGSPERRIEVLRALGNAGHAGSIDAIVTWLADPSERVRAAAADALRRIEGDRVDALLVGLTRDASGTVRRASVDVIGKRAPTLQLATAIATLLRSEPDAAIRMQAATVAAGWLGSVGDVLRDPLGWMAAHDPEAAIRKVAASALQG